jgi:hypothetical protein
MRQAGHVARMKEMGYIPGGKEPLGRSRCTWDNTIKMILMK